MSKNKAFQDYFKKKLDPKNINSEVILEIIYQKHINLWGVRFFKQLDDREKKWKQPKRQFSESETYKKKNKKWDYPTLTQTGTLKQNLLSPTIVSRERLKLVVALKKPFYAKYLNEGDKRINLPRRRFFYTIDDIFKLLKKELNNKFFKK